MFKNLIIVLGVFAQIAYGTIYTNTVGTGGDYATIGLYVEFLNTLSAAAGGDTFICNQVSDVVEDNGDHFITSSLYLKTIIFTCENNITYANDITQWYKITKPAGGAVIQQNFLTYVGVLKVQNLYFYHVTNDFCIRNINKSADGSYIKNCVFDSCGHTNGAAVVTTENGAAHMDMYNCLFYKCVPTRANGGTPVADTSVHNHLYNLCVIVDVGQIWNYEDYNSAAVNPIMRNAVMWRTDGSAVDFPNDSTSYCAIDSTTLTCSDCIYDFNKANEFEDTLIGSGFFKPKNTGVLFSSGADPTEITAEDFIGSDYGVPFPIGAYMVLYGTKIDIMCDTLTY